ncbi:hypothetical protein N0V90_011812 [Kalmusia sp. IMI 367209]|nr:hypothetical protein N0V90_011812 [Kalmusia sp. IMI 367209]
MALPAPTELPTRDLFRLDGRTIVISGGIGAVGSTVGKAILESGGDVVLLDMPPTPDPQIWSKSHDPILLLITHLTQRQKQYKLPPLQIAPGPGINPSISPKPARSPQSSILYETK